MGENTRDYTLFIQGLDRLMGKGSQKSVVEKTMRVGAKELGSKLAKNTPTYDGVRDDYPVGQLKKGWFDGRSNVNEFVETMPIKHIGSTLEMTFDNRVTNAYDMEFASFVEEGHYQEVGRFVWHNQVNARLVRPFIEGVHYTDTAVNEAEITIPTLMEIELQNELDKNLEF